MQLIGLNLHLVGLCLRFSIGLDEDSHALAAIPERSVSPLDGRAAVHAGSNGSSGH
jgi:hypothetical protein